MVILRHRLLDAIYRVAAKPWLSLSPVQHSIPVQGRIQAGDCAIIRHKGRTIELTPPLRPKARISTRFGEIAHDAIIGKQPRDVVLSSRNYQLRVHLPTLEEYVVLTPRLVTPIYAPDANLIVSLLDMHPNPSESTVDENQGIEVLEAGTGHGALTLHLARAVHAANAGSYISEATSGVPASLTGSASIRRQAVIHTIDVSEKYSEHAARIVSSFRRGMYRRDIRFYVGDVSEWIDERLNRPDQQPFLSHALLDLPSTHSVVEKASSALRVDGKLVVFNPSITQINKTIELVKIRRLPLQLDRVVEVGPAMTGGRVWDVRFVKPRALTKRLNEGQAAATGGDDDRVIGTGEELHGNVVVDDDSAKVDEGEEMVCRPKVGDRISGGGFVALWSKNKTRRDGQ